MEIEIFDVLINTIEKVKKFINITSVFTCDVDVEQSKYKIDGKSLMGVFSLDLTKPIMVRITSDNEFESRKFVELMEEFRTND